MSQYESPYISHYIDSIKKEKTNKQEAYSFYTED